MDTTQIVTAKYTEVYDISTDLNKNVFYKIHTPTGVSHMKKLAGFYKQFKEYRYLGARIAWVPITTLPKDPLGVGYEAGDQADPRDLINPIIHKGYKGEALKIDFLSENALRSENADMTDNARTTNPRMTESGGVSRLGNMNADYTDWVKSIYYTSLTDPEWQKAHPREGFYTELYPLIRKLASTKAIGGKGLPEGLTHSSIVTGQNDIEALPQGTTSGNYGEFVANQVDPGLNPIGNSWSATGTYQTPESWLGVAQGDVFTHEFERLGWMETSGQGTARTLATASGAAYNNQGTANWTDLDLNRMPKIYMYLVQTPPAYKQRQYYRMSITHDFAFRKFRQVYGIDGANVWSDEEITRAIDVAPYTVAGAKMMDRTGTVHSGDYIVPTYEPALENTIETEEGASITKISDGVS